MARDYPQKSHLKEWAVVLQIGMIFASTAGDNWIICFPDLSRKEVSRLFWILMGATCGWRIGDRLSSNNLQSTIGP
jgi:hypothetical protein